MFSRSNLSQQFDNKSVSRLMKLTKQLVILMLAAGIGAGSFSLNAEDKPAPSPSKEKLKPYPLKTCVVSDEKIDEKGEMKPYIFAYKGQEVKLCCKSCLEDFNKEPAKYVKKIDTAAKEAKSKK
jgi:hypothetical protein